MADVNTFYTFGLAAAPIGVVVKDSSDLILEVNSINIIESDDTYTLPKGERGELVKITNPLELTGIILEPFLDDKIQNQTDNETLEFNDATASLELFYTGDTYGWLITNAT